MSRQRGGPLYKDQAITGFYRRVQPVAAIPTVSATGDALPKIAIASLPLVSNGQAGTGIFRLTDHFINVTDNAFTNIPNNWGNMNTIPMGAITSAGNFLARIQDSFSALQPYANTLTTIMSNHGVEYFKTVSMKLGGLAYAYGTVEESELNNFKAFITNLRPYYTQLLQEDNPISADEYFERARSLYQSHMSKKLLYTKKGNVKFRFLVPTTQFVFIIRLHRPPVEAGDMNRLVLPSAGVSIRRYYRYGFANLAKIQPAYKKPTKPRKWRKTRKFNKF